MKRFLRHTAALLLALVLAASIGLAAVAAPPVITFLGKEKGFSVRSDSEYTTTDLFERFKGLMPGDVRTQVITLQNNAADCDHIRVYLRAVPHDNKDNKPTYNKEAAGNRPLEDAGLMEVFLSQLSVRVYADEELLYWGLPTTMDDAAQDFYLAELSAGQKLTLKVELEVPIELDNTYADALGEVDWTFVAECYDTSIAPMEPGTATEPDAPTDPAGSQAPADQAGAESPAAPAEDNADTEMPQAPDTPAASQVPAQGTHARPRTGDDSGFWLVVAVLALAALVAVNVQPKKPNRH